MKQSILLALFSTAACLPTWGAQTWTSAKTVDGAFAEALWTMMGPEYMTIHEGARVKEKFTTCLRVHGAGNARFVCESLGSDSHLFGPVAEELFRLLPVHSQGQDGRGGVYRGSRIACTETGEAPALTHLCAIAQ